jgi:DNA anti-recombination protein RmuC
MSELKLVDGKVTRIKTALELAQKQVEEMKDKSKSVAELVQRIEALEALVNELIKDIR